MTMQSQIAQWLKSGQTGISSKAIANAAMGYSQEEPWLTYGNYPSDPADLNRCLVLLHAAPEAREHLHKVASVSKVWARFIKHWDQLEAQFISEAGLNWSKSKVAPITHEMMRAIIKNQQLPVVAH